MIVKLEKCWNGGRSYSFRLTLPDGRRESISGDDGGWTKKRATEALDRLSTLYHLPRHSIRFHHVN